MDTPEYDRQLRLLGLHGPMGELILPSGAFVLVYKMPDGSHKHLPPSSDLTAEHRVELIDAPKRHLGAIDASDD